MLVGARTWSLLPTESTRGLWLTLWNCVASVRLSLLRLHPATPESKDRSPSAAGSKHVTCKHDHIEDLPRARRKACRVKSQSPHSQIASPKRLYGLYFAPQASLANCGEVRGAEPQNQSENARKPPRTGYASTQDWAGAATTHSDARWRTRLGR